MATLTPTQNTKETKKEPVHQIGGRMGDFETLETENLEARISQTITKITIAENVSGQPFSGSFSFQESHFDVTSTIATTFAQEMGQTPEPTSDSGQEAAFSQFILASAPKLGGQVAQAAEFTTQAVQVATEGVKEIGGAGLDLLMKDLLGKVDPVPTAKDTEEKQKQEIVNKQNAATAAQAAETIQAISEARDEQDFQRVGGDEVAAMSNAEKVRLLNLQAGIKRKFSAKDAADLRAALKDIAEKQKAAKSLPQAPGKVGANPFQGKGEMLKGGENPNHFTKATG